MKPMFSTDTVRDLSDRYELDQLVPTYTEPNLQMKTKLGRAIANIPETTSVKMRMAVFEAVIDDIIEEEILDEDGNQVQSSEVEEKVLETVDKAIDLHLVPSTIRKRIPTLIARHMKKLDPRMRLVSKAAHFLANSMVKMEESDTVVTHLVADDEVVEDALDMKNADEGTDIVNDTAERTGDNAQEGGSVPINRMRTRRRMEDNVVVNDKADDEVVEDALDTKEADDGYDIVNDTAERKGDNAQEGGSVPVNQMRRKHYSMFGMGSRFEEDFVEVNDVADKQVVNEELDTKEADDGYDIDRETVEHTGDAAQEGGSVPINKYKPKNKRFSYRMLNGRVVMEEVEADEPVVEQALDSDKADEGVDVTKEVIEPEGDTAQTDGTTPTIVDESMKYLAVSAVNHQKATAAVARNISSRLLVNMLHELRYVLPAKFKAKYSIK